MEVESRDVMQACYVRAGNQYFVPFDDDGVLSCNDCTCDNGLVCEAPDWQTATRLWGALLFVVQVMAIALSAVLWEWDRLFLGGFPLFFRVDDWNDGITEPWDIPGLLHAPNINKIPISAVASDNTSGVFVTAIPLFFSASKSIFPKPTAKFEIIFIVSGNLSIVSLSILSVREVKIPSHP